MGFTAPINHPLKQHGNEGHQPVASNMKRHPIIQGLIAFLQSPFWINPIQSFIDENCLYFDGEEENCLELTQVHERFRELIENLLEFLLGEMHVSHEEVCSSVISNRSLHHLAEKFIKVLMAETNDETLGQALEHIMAMDDYLSFRKIMERRNLQLECEALEYVVLCSSTLIVNISSVLSKRRPISKKMTTRNCEKLWKFPKESMTSS